MKNLQRLVWVLVSTTPIIVSLGVAAGGTVTSNYDFLGYNAPSANMETFFGPRSRHLDAAAAGFNFGTPEGPFYELNVISDVYRANRTITIGTGQNGTSITLHPGDLTFAYTLDFTFDRDPEPVVAQSQISDFQIVSVIASEAPTKPPVYNPGPFIAVENIYGGAFNTATEFNGLALDVYKKGLKGYKTDNVAPYLLKTSRVQFSWPADRELMPEKKAMVLLFCHDVTWKQVGSGTVDTGEGGNVLCAGVGLNDFPVLVPVVPEPASLAMLILGGTLFCRRQRQNR